ncbi:MAG: DNA replication and repair protein RecF, partial [Bacteroidales bacterium]|nr:DNA replication and repair protein RecF [Bacteroidales bacterium]
HEQVSCGFKLNGGKVFKRNGNEYERLAEHIGLLPVVMVSPADSALIAGAGDERRRYMNNVISQYDRLYLDEVMRYGRALAQRNSLLKSGRLNPDLIEAIDAQLAVSGQRIYDKRLYFIDQLTPIFQEHYAQVSGRPEQVSLSYRSHLHNADMAQLLRQSFDRDRAMQHTTVGVHRDDMQLLLNGFPIRREGSQGQQKTYLIALKLAQLNFIGRVAGLNPMLLLDDIFDKLDADRVQQLIALVAKEEFGQIFITDTNPMRLHNAMAHNGLTYSLFHVYNGTAVPHTS